MGPCRGGYRWQGVRSPGHPRARSAATPRYPRDAHSEHRRQATSSRSRTARGRLLPSVRARRQICSLLTRYAFCGFAGRCHNILPQRCARGWAWWVTWGADGGHGRPRVLRVAIGDCGARPSQGVRPSEQSWAPSRRGASPPPIVRDQHLIADRAVCEWTS